MNPQFLYYMFLTILAACSIWFFSKAIIGILLSGRSIVSRYNRHSALSKYKRGKKAVDNTGNTGNFPTPFYQIIRIVSFGVWSVLVILGVILYFFILGDTNSLKSEATRIFGSGIDQLETIP